MTIDRALGTRMVAGRYSLRERLATGGMGEVWAGWDRVLDRPVAVKVLGEEAAANAAARRRFQAEARAAARLAHPNIVQVYDSGEDDGHPFIVMERLPGRSLRDEIASGPMELGAVRAMALQVLSALGAAHEAGLVHRDIKPGNVLDDGGGQWKVADFGIAKSMQPDSADETVTGMVIGTPAYLPPERLLGGEATPSGDAYALGVILYEALAGRRPFNASSPEGWAGLAAADAPSLRSVRPDVPGNIADAVDRSIARDPGARFASVGEMARVLQGTERTGTARPLPARGWREADAARALAGVTTLTGSAAPERTDLLPASGKPARPRRKGAAGISLAAVLMVAGGLAVAAGFGSHPHRTPAPALSTTTFLPPTTITTVPAVTVPAVTVPAVTVPAMTVPATGRGGHRNGDGGGGAGQGGGSGDGGGNGGRHGGDHGG